MALAAADADGPAGKNSNDRRERDDGLGAEAGASALPSPEMLQASVETDQLVSAGLARKVWTQSDMLELQAQLPLLVMAARQEQIRRLVQAVNAQQLNVDATRGQLF